MSSGSNQGRTSITVENVAKRMQVAPSTLYRYFQRGRNLLLANKNIY